MQDNRIRIISHKDLDKNSNDFLSFNAHYLQSIEWCKCKEDCLVSVEDNEKDSVAMAVLRFKVLPLKLGSICYIDRGPIGRNNADIMNHLKGLIAYLSAKNVVYTMCSPMAYTEESVNDISKNLVTNGWIQEDNTLSLYKSTLVINLKNNLDVIRSKFRRSLKTQLNKSEKLGITVELEPNESAVDEFVKYFNDMAENRGLSLIDDNTQNFILQSQKNNNAKILLASIEDKLLAGVILMKQGNRVIYEWGMNTQDPKFKKLPLAHKIHWEAIKWAKNEGYMSYDFGGYWLDRGNKDPINYFKLGFTKEVEIVTPEFYYIHQPLKFIILNILKKIRKAFK